MTINKKTKVTRTVTTIVRETCWVELPEDHEDYDSAELDDLVTELAARVEIDEDVIDVIDSTRWEVKGKS